MSQARQGLLCMLVRLALGGTVVVPSLVLAGGGIGPEIPPAKGERCVEPTEVMRRNHFEYILHQRDETMHRGIRTQQYSLNQCISCHVLPTAQGEYPAAGESEHFCSSCHTYAAVQIDCFQCHADRPMDEGEGKGKGKGEHGPLPPGHESLHHSHIGQAARRLREGG